MLAFNDYSVIYTSGVIAIEAMVPWLSSVTKINYASVWTDNIFLGRSPWAVYALLTTSTTDNSHNCLTMHTFKGGTNSQ